MPFSNISILFTNIRSLIRKREELCSVADSCNADVIALTETWLSSKVTDSELFNCQKRFNTFRCDRRDRSGGGVLLAVADSIISRPVIVACELEIVWVCLNIKHKKKKTLSLCGIDLQLAALYL